MNVREAIEKRRAYRSLAPVEITPELIADLARFAQLAPSCNNNQPWRFVFVHGKEDLEKFHPVLNSPGNDWARAASLIVAVCSRKADDCLIRDREYHLFGDGLAAVFESFGVASVVRGGQSANPSTGELLSAIDALDADEVLLLPNNPNVVLAARQVAALTRIPVRVVATRNAAEGVAALLALDPSLDGTENAAPMLEAARAVQTLQVTDAVRDARIGGKKVRKGQTIVLDPDDGLVAVDGDRDRALLAGLQTLRPGFELITLYYGDGADLAEAEAVSQLVAAWRPDVEVELVHGGQPHYRYLVAAE